jgi:hypothetical protein
MPWFSAASEATCAPGPPQCAEVKPIRLPRLSLPIAVNVQNASPLITMPEPPPSGTRSAARAGVTVGASSAMATATTLVTTAPRHHCVLCCTPGTSNVCPDPLNAKLGQSRPGGTVEPRATWQHDPQ